MDQKQSVQHFLDLIKRSHRGKFKIYIGMIAGVGKSYRMLQEAHQLLEVGVDVKIGYIETHGRPDTEALVSGLPVIARRKLFYKGKELEEMDLQGILNTHPEIVIVDELAHTNIEGSEHAKRWQDVLQILEAGISVISAVNIQHIESLNEEVQRVSGIEIRERIPDSVLAMADEVVNIDLTAEELIKRLKDGKIYKPEKVQVALDNFFKEENILQLRELALKEVALRVEKKVENEVSENIGVRHEKFLAVIDSSDKGPRRVIRNTSVPLGISTPNEPNISSTRWRTVSDQKNLTYFFESTLYPNVFWVDFRDVDFAPGAPVKMLDLVSGKTYAGNAAERFRDAAPFEFQGIG